MRGQYAQRARLTDDVFDQRMALKKALLNFEDSPHYESLKGSLPRFATNEALKILNPDMFVIAMIYLSNYPAAEDDRDFVSQITPLIQRVYGTPNNINSYRENALRYIFYLRQ